MADLHYLAAFKREHIDSMARFDDFKGHIKLADNFTQETAENVCAICLFLRSRGFRYSTEVKTNYDQKKRADIVCPELWGAQIIEVYDTEGVKSLDAKREVYALHGLDMFAVPAEPLVAVAMIKAQCGLGK